MSDIKMIVSDVDGTLVDRTERIPQALVEIVERCRRAGIVFALSTGRTNELAAPFIAALGITDPCVEANGAYIRQGDVCLLEHGFSVEPIRAVLYRAHHEGLTVTLADTRVERATRRTDYVREHQQIGGRFKELLPLESIHWSRDRFQKVMVMDEHRTGKIDAIRACLAAYADRYWITTYSDKAVELGPRGCNKASGVRELAGLLQIDMRHVMACGDFWNDFEMISQVGWGVAVGNALPELKAAARYVARGTYAQGVVEAIRALCFGELPQQDG